MKTLCYPPTTFLFLQLKSKLNFGVGGMHANSHIFEQNAPRNLSSEINGSKGELSFGWVQQPPHSIWKHCVTLLSLFCSCGWRVNLILVCEASTQIVIFSSKMHQENSHSKWFQGINLFWLGAVASKYCMRTLPYLPTTFLFLRLKNKLDFAAAVCTQIVLFWSKMHQGNTYLEWFQRKAFFWFGAVASK